MTKARLTEHPLSALLPSPFITTPSASFPKYRSFTLTDSHGESLVAGHRLKPVRVVRSGMARPAALATRKGR
jgi:hypothetical protein